MSGRHRPRRGVTLRRSARTLFAASGAALLAAVATGCGGSGDPHHAAAKPAGGGDRVAATVSATATPSADHNAGPHPNLGPFAGYEWSGTVRSVHADWTVPRLTADSPAGQAAAWVGAEAPGASGHAPFVQIGVHEGNNGGPPGTPPIFYFAFYSTTKLDFRPKPLFEVAPGDVVSATMRRAGRRWRLEIEDETSGRRRTLTTAEGAGRVFNDAEFNQEDVTDSRTGKPYPYPSLSALRFSQLSVNGAPPVAGRLDSSWLTEADGYLAPGPLRHGAFRLAHVAMTTAGYRYLKEIAAQDAAETGGMTSLAHWATGGGSATAFADAHRLALVLHGTASRLSATRWPPAARRSIAALRTDAHRLVGLLDAIGDVPDGERIVWAQHFYALFAALGREGRAARAALELPSAAVLPSG